MLINVVQALRITHRYTICSIPHGKASGMLNRFPLTFISQTTLFWNAGISFYCKFLFCSECAVDPPWISFSLTHFFFFFFCLLRHCISVLFSKHFCLHGLVFIQAWKKYCFLGKVKRVLLNLFNVIFGSD